MNVNNDLQPFEWIVPCGIDHCQMSSVARELRREQDVEAFADRLCTEFGRVYGREPVAVSPERLDDAAGGARVSESRHVTRSRARPGGGAGAEEVVLPFRERKPSWLKVKAPGSPSYRRIQALMRNEGLHTVCEEANCPNIGECWERGTATFMILGDVCTRRCGFCNVRVGDSRPRRPGGAVSGRARRLPDGPPARRRDIGRSRRPPRRRRGRIRCHDPRDRARAPGCAVEVLTPDFRGQEMPLARVIDARPDVFNHNVETVPRLYPKARRGSDFLRSCRVLLNARRMDPEVVTKSGLMVGLGEELDELLEAFAILREHEVEVLTVASTCARPGTICHSCGTGPRTSSRRSSARPTRWASRRSPRAPSYGARTTPTSRSRCGGRARPRRRPAFQPRRSAAYGPPNDSSSSRART